MVSPSYLCSNLSTAGLLVSVSSVESDVVIGGGEEVDVFVDLSGDAQYGLSGSAAETCGDGGWVASVESGESGFCV